MWYKTIRLTKKSLFWICALLTGVVISQHRQSIKRGDLAAIPPVCLSDVRHLSSPRVLRCRRRESAVDFYSLSYLSWHSLRQQPKHSTLTNDRAKSSPLCRAGLHHSPSAPTMQIRRLRLTKPSQHRAVSLACPSCIRSPPHSHHTVRY